MSDELTWTTADDREIRVSDLTDAHLKNIVRHCRKYRYPTLVTRYFELVAFQRGLGEVTGEPEPWLDERDGLVKTYEPPPYPYSVIK